MDAIAASYCSSKACPDSTGAVPRYVGTTAVLRKKFSFSRPRKVLRFGTLRLATEKLKPLSHVASVSSSNAEVGIERAEEDGAGEAHSVKTVHVRFQLRKECQFGEQFLLVGDDPMFGSWDPSVAVPMNWSDGNLWTLDLDVPVGREIRFKFILKGITAIVQWQPDPDRVLRTWDTDDTITVCEDWEDAASQKIIEGEPPCDPEVVGGSELKIIADNLSPPAEKFINGSALADIVAAPEEIPPYKARDESVMAETVVAENIDPITGKPSMCVADNINQTEEILSPEAKSRDKNLKARANNSARTTSDQADLVAFDEGPVLVPGLTPVSMALAKEPIHLESGSGNATDVLTGFEAMDPKAPELKEVSGSDRGGGGGGGAVEELTKEENEDPPDKDGVLRNDIQWGRKTLHSFLANLGLLS